MDDLLRELQRRARQGDERARARLAAELKRLGAAAYPFRGIEQPPPSESPGDDAPLLEVQNAQKAGADVMWSTRSRASVRQRRRTKRSGHRRHRTHVRQNLRAWSRDPRDYLDE